MKVSAPAITVPIVAGLISAFSVSVHTWEGLRGALLPAMSVIAAAVLVRLARGLPFTNPDHFTLGQFRDVAAKLESNARKLRALIVLCLLGLAGLIVAPMINNVLEREQLPLFLPMIVESILSGALGYLISYAFVRVVEVVQSDVGLLRLQSKIIEGAIASKNAKTFEKIAADKVPGGIAGAKGFGGSIV